MSLLVKEVEPDDIEKSISEQYRRKEQELVDLDDLVQELGLNREKDIKTSIDQV